MRKSNIKFLKDGPKEKLESNAGYKITKLVLHIKMAVFINNTENIYCVHISYIFFSETSYRLTKEP